jgi:Spy/CpxP family protein refolding chaperone
MRTSTRSPGLLVLLAVIASSSLACKEGGCGGGGAGAPSASASPSASAPASAAASASGSALTPRGAPRPPAVNASGMTGSIFYAVNAVELKDEQKAAIDKIGADFREADRAARVEDGGGPRSEMRDAQAELASGVKAGKIDAAKMEPRYVALEKAAKARQDREADALNRLYATLEPAQRAALVASVRSKEERREARMKGHERPDAGARAARVLVDRFTRELDLDAEQQKKAEAIAPKADKTVALQDDIKKRSDALLAAFEKEGFDARKLDTGAAKLARSPIEEQAIFLGQLLPTLKPEQRERLVKHLTKGGDGHGRLHRGMGTGDHAHELPEDEPHE